MMTEPDVVVWGSGGNLFADFSRPGANRELIHENTVDSLVGLIPFEGGALQILETTEGETQFNQVAFGDPDIRQLVLEGRLLEDFDIGE